MGHLKVTNTILKNDTNRRKVKKSLQPSLVSSHGCIYTKVAVSTSSINLCVSYHVTWTALHAWLHYHISIKTMHFGHCLYTREMRCINRPTWIWVMLNISIYLQNKTMEYSDFWKMYKSINSLVWYSFWLLFLINDIYLKESLFAWYYLLKIGKKLVSAIVSLFLFFI